MLRENTALRFEMVHCSVAKAGHLESSKFVMRGQTNRSQARLRIADEYSIAQRRHV